MSSNFFEQQDVARRNTGVLVLLFLAAVVLIILAVYAIFTLVFVNLSDVETVAGRPAASVARFWDPQLFLWVTLGTVAVIGAGSLYKMAELSSGGEPIALMLGGRKINFQTGDFAERRLLNVVEEMALASGVPVPPVYVLEGESSINAFAAGHRPGDAVIGVSRGALDYLDRDELQGVMAHEFSHILNGDMRINLRLVGVLHGILLLAIVGYYVLRSGGHSSSNRKGGAGAVLLFGLGLIAIGSVGLFFGRLIESAVSRQREFLADASAVQFTRLPDGIAGALKKIGGLSQGSRIGDVRAGEVGHMFFGDVFGGMSLNWFSTHPPLAERIRRIDPSFDGRFPEVKRQERPASPEPGPKPAQPAPMPGRMIGRTISGAAGGGFGAGMEQILYAAAIIDLLPDPVVQSAHEPYGARAIIYGLLLDRNEQIRQRQLAALQQRAEPLSYKETLRLGARIDQLPADARIPLADMTIPALKELSPEQYGRFAKNIDALVKADDRIDLFEYTLQKMVLWTLDAHFGRRKSARPQYYGLGQLGHHLAVVLGTLAHAGHSQEQQAEAAFQASMQYLDISGAFPPRQACSLQTFDQSLVELAKVSIPIRQKILEACRICVTADQQVTTRERELVRAVAAVLECPTPITIPRA
ncbi:MAG: M48 family metallopeptidase [Pirellulales bacterium]|nr:M48 family metallopeptidase [Pirellulales bacterium]